MTAEEFASRFAVSPPALQKLQRYADLLAEWQQRMNLVGPATLADLWGRHFADSAQLAGHVPPGQRWLDFGAGAGFPGMVLAILGAGHVTLVESVAKKVQFLAMLRQELQLESVTLLHGRVERLPPLHADVVTARAVAPLSRLFDWSIRHARPGGRFLFPKGKQWAEEVQEAKRHFSFDFSPLPSMTDEAAGILLAWNVKRH